MRRSLRALAFGALFVGLGLVSFARAEDKDEKKDKGYDTKLPLNPFASAKEGDWCVMIMQLKPPKGQDVPKGMLEPKYVEWRITKIDGDTVTMTESEGGDHKKEHTFSKKETPTLGKYLDMKSRGKLEDVKIEDTKTKVGDKEQACKKITFTEKEEGATIKGAIVLCETVKGGGMVTLTADFAGPRGSMQMSGELVGWGHGDKADWGKTFGEVSKKEKDGKDEEKGEKEEK